MAFLKIADARAAASTALRYNTEKSADRVLRKEARSTTDQTVFDVFLSHAFADAEVILGVKKILEAQNISVYVDWIDDPGLDRNEVTHKTAGVLRKRLRASKTLVYAHSAKAPDSKWMPWELGYFDGFKPKSVFVLPLVEVSDSEFSGQEYLGLYPIVEQPAAVATQISLGFRIGSGGETRFLNLRETIMGTGVYLS